MTRPGAAPEVAVGPGTSAGLGRPFVFLWCNSVTYQLVASADRFTFVWLSRETLGASRLVAGIVVFSLGIPMFLFVLAAGAMADRGTRACDRCSSCSPSGER